MLSEVQETDALVGLPVWFTELRFGTQIGAMSVLQLNDGRLRVAVSGPGLVVTELRKIES